MAQSRIAAVPSPESVFEGPGEGLDIAQVALLNERVIEGIEVNEGPDGMPGMEQPLAAMRANEASAARNEEIHASRLTDKGAPCREPDNG
jgi:hypothetical protein